MRSLLFLTLAIGRAQAQTLTTLAAFNPSTGALTTLYTFPETYANSLVQGSDGNFYGTTAGNGCNSQGTLLGAIFKLTPEGLLTTLYSFHGSDGAHPAGDLIQESDGNFYGTTLLGGFGTVFKITPSGTLTTLYNFAGPDGAAPNGLVQGKDGNFYGTTEFGGSGCCAISTFPNGCGTVFKLTPAGALTTLYSFVGLADGAYPATGLLQAANGILYGTNQAGGGISAIIPGQVGGAVFQITPAGAVTTLHDFGISDGVELNEPPTLMQATDGNFYGTLMNHGRGTLFQRTPVGTLATLYYFCSENNCADGARPGSLLQTSDGNFYGTTSGYASPSSGTVFKFSLAASGPPAIAASSGVLNGASFQPGIPANSWITITGTNLSSQMQTWYLGGLNQALPTTLNNVQVMVGNQPPYIAYVSKTQINALAPNASPGTVTVTNSNGASQAVMAQVLTVQPAFFEWGSYAVATHQDFSPAVKWNLLRRDHRPRQTGRRHYPLGNGLRSYQSVGTGRLCDALHHDLQYG